MDIQIINTINTIFELKNNCCISKDEYNEYCHAKSDNKKLYGRAINYIQYPKKLRVILDEIHSNDKIINRHAKLLLNDTVRYLNILKCDAEINKLHQLAIHIPTDDNPKNTTINDLQQDKFIMADINNSKLFGIPGGGKTKTIIDKILYLKKHEQFTSKNFIILTFSRRACNDFLKKGQRMCKKMFIKQNIKTIHSLAGTIMYALRKKNTTCLQTLVLSSIKYLTEHCTKDDLLTIKCLAECKLIIVDEAQDISQNQYALIMLLQQMLYIPVIMVGDPNQNIYQFQHGSDKYLLEHEGDQITYTNNYRSTIEIIDFINQLRPHSKLPKMVSARNDHGIKPRIQISSMDDILKNIIYEIITSNYAYHDIAIIGPIKKSHPDAFGSYKNVGLNLVANILHEYHIPYIVHYVQGNDKYGSDAKILTKLDHVNLFTIHGAKGLEFKKVMVINCHFRSMGITPTLASYHELRYLWYVAMSRASDELIIYVDQTKKTYPGLFLCDTHTYVSNKKLIPFDYVSEFRDEFKQICFPVKDTVNDINYFTEEQLLIFEESSGYTLKSRSIYEINHSIKLDNKYAMFYGEFMENIFMFYYGMSHGKKKDFIEYVLDFFRTMIIIPKKYAEAFSNIKKYGCHNMMNRDILHKLKDLVDYRLIAYISNCIQDDNKMYRCIQNSSSIDYRKECVVACCKQLRKANDIHLINKLIFKITLIIYCIQNETKFMLSERYDDHKPKLIYHIKKIIKYVATLPDGYQCQGNCSHPNLPIYGTYDIITPNHKIIELKFVTQITISHVLQVMMYYNNLYPDWKQEKKIYITNLFTGIQYQIIISKQYTNYDFLKYICDTLSIKMTNNIFVYDLETDGTDFHNPDIIERHFVELFLGYVPSSGLIKTKKRIPEFITKLTGIDNDMLINADMLDVFIYDMQTIYKYCEKPSFIAHNGNSFDHRLLKQKGILKESDSHFLDSKSIIPMVCVMDNLHRATLEEIYQMIVGKKCLSAHRAEADVMMLVKIFRKLGLTRSDFVM